MVKKELTYRQQKYEAKPNLGTVKIVQKNRRKKNQPEFKPATSRLNTLHLDHSATATFAAHSTLLLVYKWILKLN